jgi:flagellar basal body-associated protein FliL
MMAKATNRHARKVLRTLLEVFLLFVALASVGVSALHGQSPQASCSGKPQAAAATPAATPSSATLQTAQPNGAGLVWVNTDNRVYHKQGTRWYGKTKHGKYMLEADAIKAGYKAAK